LGRTRVPLHIVGEFASNAVACFIRRTTGAPGIRHSGASGNGRV